MSVLYSGDRDEGTIASGPLAPLQVVQFQRGPMLDGKQNGVQTEQVMELLVLRLQDLQQRLPCRENEQALVYLEQAKMWLEKRTALREQQGVEATEEPHSS